MKQFLALMTAALLSFQAIAQQPDTTSKPKRLDFARTYFEGGGTIFPSFTGQAMLNGRATNINNPASVSQYLSWGAFHFWGHGEFYVTFPLGQHSFSKQTETSYELIHAVSTGARIYPFAFRGNGLRPYVGFNWGALDFVQQVKPGGQQPRLSKDIMLNYDAGFIYGYRSFAMRIGVNYLRDNSWAYPISTTQHATIKTPPLAFQAGLSYSFEGSRKVPRETQDRWNSYPTLSKTSYASTKFGDFFIGAGPSLSFSLGRSAYNQRKYPYLKDKLTSGNYFDIAAGYHFYKLGLFSALSFRSPKFETSGYGSSQTIRKTAFALEVNKFLTDYTGFAPYVGFNASYDRLKYTEKTPAGRMQFIDSRIEPGLTFGWDIIPGKLEEVLILRTNVRWYPWSSFKVEGEMFDFKQVEYNLIQVVFYPGRWRR